MKRCVIKRGFLVVRPCGERADKGCARCHRPTCAEHRELVVGLSGLPDELCCRDCASQARGPSNPLFLYYGKSSAARDSFDDKDRAGFAVRSDGGDLTDDGQRDGFADS